MVRKHVRYKFVFETNKGHSSGFFSNIQSIIPLVTACIGIFVGLAYLTGKIYSNGYFYSMNIPGYVINYTIQDYSVLSWIYILTVPSVLYFLGGFFGIVINLIIKLFNKLLFSSKIKNNNKIDNFINRFIKDNLDFLWIMFFSFYALIFVYIIYFTLNFTSISSIKNGKNEVLENSMIITMTSQSPISLLDQSNSAEWLLNGDKQYVYSGFRLLTINNGKYYLFKDIDPDTCRPKQVFVVNDSPDIQFTYAAAESLVGRCRNP